jgi:hypothetical protein
MNTVKPSKPLSDFWNQQITKWQQTDQSQIGYCRAHDLDYHRFTYWRRKFASLMKKNEIAVRSSFVPVKACSTKSSELTATLPNGVILGGIATDNLSIVKQLLGLHS